MRIKILNLLQLGSVSLVYVFASLQGHPARGSSTLQPISSSNLLDEPSCQAASTLSLLCNLQDLDVQAHLSKLQESPVDFGNLHNSLQEGYNEILGQSPLRLQPRDDNVIDYTKCEQGDLEHGLDGKVF